MAIRQSKRFVKTLLEGYWLEQKSIVEHGKCIKHMAVRQLECFLETLLYGSSLNRKR